MTTKRVCVLDYDVLLPIHLLKVKDHLYFGLVNYGLKIVHAHAQIEPSDVDETIGLKCVEDSMDALKGMAAAGTAAVTTVTFM